MTNGAGMLAVVQAGQVGKTSLLIDMHRLRKRVFKDRLAWAVNISRSGMEVDAFDLPEAFYLLAVSEEGRVCGSWRFLPTSGPTMIRDIWPEFMTSIDLPVDPLVWEGSRFAVEKSPCSGTKGLAQINRTTQELFCGITELCIHCGIREIFTLYDLRIARLLQRLNCSAKQVSSRICINGLPTEVGRFVTNRTMLERLRHSAGIHHNLIDTRDLPLGLIHYLHAYTKLDMPTLSGSMHHA
jgi:N-acyl-L-homoserine lactone synthetase